MIKGEGVIQEPDNQIERAKYDSITDEKKKEKKLHNLKNKEYYIGNTNEKTPEFDDYPNDTDGCATNLGNEN